MRGGVADGWGPKRQNLTKRRGLGEGRFRLTYRGFPQLAAQPCASCWGAERPRHCRCTSSASRCRGRWCQLESWTWPWKPLSVMIVSTRM